jgi:hypothetical protein
LNELTQLLIELGSKITSLPAVRRIWCSLLRVH